MAQVKDLTGKKFNHGKFFDYLTLTKKSHNAYFACRCDICGQVYDVRSDSLQRGTSTKCMRCARNIREYGDYANII